jgi:hypothetical protein
MIHIWQASSADVGSSCDERDHSKAKVVCRAMNPVIRNNKQDLQYRFALFNLLFLLEENRKGMASNKPGTISF